MIVPPLFAKWVLSVPDFLCGVAGVVADYTYIYREREREREREIHTYVYISDR